MRLQPAAARQVDGTRRDVVDGGELIRLSPLNPNNNFRRGNSCPYSRSHLRARIAQFPQPRTASRRKVKVSLGLHPYLPALRLPFSLSPPQGSNWRHMSAKSPTHVASRVNKTSQRASRKCQ